MRKTILVALLLAVFSCVFGNSVFAAANTATVKTHIVKHALALGIDPALALSIAKTESGFCHEKRSRQGAVGVFQLMPSTARRLGYNPYYLNDNILGALTYYKMLYNKFGSVELALAAYNAGPGTVKRYGGMPPYKETKRYVRTIMNEYKVQQANPDPAIKKTNTTVHKTATTQTAVKKPANTVPRPSMQTPVQRATTEEEANVLPENVLSLYAKQKSNIVN